MQFGGHAVMMTQAMLTTGLSLDPFGLSLVVPY
jgi:hypothetical protein